MINRCMITGVSYVVMTDTPAKTQLSPPALHAR